MSEKAKPNKNLKPCKSCSKEVAKSVKKCPHCGATLKTGTFTKIVAGVIVLIVVVVIFGPSNEEIQANKAARLDNLASSPVSGLSPRGELAQTFELGSSFTDIQRDNLESEINGQIVEWNLTVYEVSKASDNVYRVQTAGLSEVGTFTTVHTQSLDEATYIENLKTGDTIKVKGSIAGVSLRNIQLNPAILVK